jgi:serine/threonine protein kinase
VIFQSAPWVSSTDIENEVRAITKLCGHDAHPNIVEVLRLGRLVGSPYYFIDMELCDMNLENYIYSNSPKQESLPHFVKTAPSSVKASQIWNIMRQIASGVAFIHSHDEVHRDLKPRNSIFF